MSKKSIGKTPAEDSPKEPQCSFCGNAASKVKRLICGPGVNICDECVDLCRRILEEEEE